MSHGTTSQWRSPCEPNLGRGVKSIGGESRNRVQEEWDKVQTSAGSALLRASLVDFEWVRPLRPSVAPHHRPKAHAKREGRGT